MGYLSNASITCDAILTKKGRQLLAKGRNEFKITQFALADDEIDYDLWNSAHPLGSDYYGAIIENMPITEAVPDETQNLRYKLVTLPKSTVRIPVITVANTTITLTSPGQSSIISPTTANFANGNTTLGYTAILSDSDAAFLEVETVAPANVSPSIPRFIGDNESAQSISVVGLTFKITAKPQVYRDKTAKITIIGNETGGRMVVDLTVKKTELASAV